MAMRVAVLVGLVLLPVLSGLAGMIGLAPLLSLPALFVISGFLFRGGGSPPGRPDGDDGGGQGPGPPVAPSGRPSGGLPLPDADQARVRARDHTRVVLVPVRARRGAREPERAPMRTLQRLAR